MGRRKLASGLHVGLQVPKLLQSDTGDIYNIRRHGDGRPGELAILKLRAERHDEVREVLIQREEAEETVRRLAIGLGFAEGASVADAFIFGDGFRIELLDFEKI